MLQQLEIENYAVVDKLRIRFHAGLNLLTGETGSGKSIVVGALSLLLGARASAEVIRGGKRQARVAAVFEPTAGPELEAFLETTGIELEQGELLIEREVLDSGKSRAYVNGRLVTLGLLRELAPALGEIHGQHEQQKLFSARTQLDMLDAFAGLEPQVEAVAGVFGEWRRIGERLGELRGNQQERLRLVDLYRFQQREIEQAGLEAGEEQSLRRERTVQQNLTRLRESATAAYDALYDSSVSAASQIKAGLRGIEDLAELDRRFDALAETLRTNSAVIEDAAFELRGYLDQLESNPQRLDEIENRLALIEQLKRKYGASVEEVISFGQDAARKLAEIESSDESTAELERRHAEAAARYESLARKLSEKRRRAAVRLAKQVEEELASLAMEKARFIIAFDDDAADSKTWRAHGVDRPVFQVSANPGQPPRPLTQVASGGELSRITLALKSRLALSAKPARAGATARTLVFDEIDSGVGGRVAEAIGRRLARLSEANQLLCVTHLPQIAGFAHAHYFVAKRERKGETLASVTELSTDERVQELARMISGEEVTPAALQHARQMLKATARKTG